MPPTPSKKGTGKFDRQGQTAGQYGQDPNVQAKGKAGDAPRELKP